MTWNPTSVPDLRGRVAVVVGPHGPRGRATADRLARGGATVVLLGAGEAALRRARHGVQHRVPNAIVAGVPVDGDDAHDVVDAGQRLLDSHLRVDLLVHSDRPTADGTGPPVDARPARTVDATATLALTAMLLPGLARARGGRIVTVTPRSDLPRPPATSPTTFPTGSPHEPFGDHARLDLLDFATVLHQRLTAGGSRIASVAADPGEAARQPGPRRGTPRHGGRRPGRRDEQRTQRRALPELRAACDPGVRAGDLLAPVFRGSRTTMRLRLGDPPPQAPARWAAAEQRCGRPVRAEGPYADGGGDGTLGHRSDARDRRRGSAG